MRTLSRRAKECAAASPCQGEAQAKPHRVVELFTECINSSDRLEACPTEEGDNPECNLPNHLYSALRTEVLNALLIGEKRNRTSPGLIKRSLPNEFTCCQVV
jgi:hypothetical protein